MLEIGAVCRSFREGEREHRVLDHAQARVSQGETVAIVGRSGSGKSTLLNIICGIDVADSGSVRVGDTEITTLPERERTLFRRRHIGFVYQFFNLLPTLTVEENVRLALELNGVRGTRARTRSREALEQVGLGDRLSSAPDVLSGGEQQRVAIARALVHEPTLLLADEPTGNLDDTAAEQAMNVMRDLVRARGTTLLIATHARAIAQGAARVLELRDGRLLDVAG